MIESATIIQSVHYLLKKLGTADKIKLIKLLYLADKYHLIRYGRTVTNDDYYAMPYGPVGTTVKDILSLSEFLSDEEKHYTNNLLTKVGDNAFRAKDVVEDYDMLSETDVEALDFVHEKYGAMSAWKLRDYTHRYPEWSQYEDLFTKGHTRRERLATKELLSVLDNDPIAAGITKEHLIEAEKTLSGRFD